VKETSRDKYLKHRRGSQNPKDKKIKKRTTAGKSVHQEQKEDEQLATGRSEGEHWFQGEAKAELPCGRSISGGMCIWTGLFILFLLDKHFEMVTLLFL
jgi:hypothetical protein